jgi:hypothetical protein
MKNLLLVVFLGTMVSSACAWADDFSPMNQDTITRTNNGTTPVANNTLPSVAANNAAVPASVGTWILQIDGETGFPTGNLNNVAAEGWGPEGSFGYRFPQNFTLSLETGYVGYAPKNGMLNTTWDIIPILLKGQYNFGSGYVQPYLFLGAGVALNSQSSSFAGPNHTAGEADFLEEAGLGISFVLLTQTYLFIQSKVEVDNTSSNYAGDQPTLLIPIDVGLNIQVN